MRSINKPCSYFPAGPLTELNARAEIPSLQHQVAGIGSTIPICDVVEISVHAEIRIHQRQLRVGRCCEPAACLPVSRRTSHKQPQSSPSLALGNLGTPLPGRPDRWPQPAVVAGIHDRTCAAATLGNRRYHCRAAAVLLLFTPGSIAWQRNRYHRDVAKGGTRRMRHTIALTSVNRGEWR